jgi:short-subunit dehydrogenase
MAQIESQKNDSGKVIWITGASSGLGRSLALALSKQGHQVIASARSKEALASLQAISESIIALPCDITDENSLKRVQEQISVNFPCLDQVILNAGTCEYLEFPEPDWSAIQRVMEVNFIGTINSLKIALPLLRKNTRARPHIIVIASQVTHAPFAKSEAYGASKAALQYFFNSLRIDLAPENIDVSVINPGFVDTPLTRKNNFEMPFLLDVDEAARRVIKQMTSRPRNYSFPKRLCALLFLSKIMPGMWQKLVSREIGKPVSKTMTNKDSKQ